jgi:hypothetical protein
MNQNGSSGDSLRFDGPAPRPWPVPSPRERVCDAIDAVRVARLSGRRMAERVALDRLRAARQALRALTRAEACPIAPE